MFTEINKIINQSKSTIKYTLVVMVVLIISLLFPKQPKEILDFKLNDVWTGSDIRAVESFPVKKETSQIEREKNEINANFLPVFDRNNDLQARMVATLRQNLVQFFENVGENSNENQRFIEKVILLTDSIYRVGIYRPIDQNREKIRIYDEPDHKLANLTELFTESSAESKLKALVELENQSYLNTIEGYINQCIEPNVIHNSKLSEQLLSEALKKVDEISFVVNEGDIIVDKNDVIDQNIYKKLKAYQQNSKGGLFTQGLNLSTFLGYLLLTCLIIGALLLYLRFHFIEIFDKLNSFLFILIWPVIFSLLVYSVENTQSLNSYIIPFCIVPIVVKNFFHERLALFLHIVIVLIASFLSKLGYEFTFLQILTGIVTVLVVSETRYWNKFFNAILIIFSTYILGYLGLALIEAESLKSIQWNTFVDLGVASLFTLLAYPFIPMLERLFGFISSITLAELSYMNHPLLKEMSIKAPGTLQHSIQVSNLSEAAAEKIGANSLLVKVGALYHDIGKLKYPEYFIENQPTINPHEKLSYFDSAKKIIDHVSEGEKMAKKARLPQVLIDFIMTHHGTTKVEYFYRKQKADFPDREFDELLFSYPGPKPRSKEEAILMIADSLEASSKSLRDPTGQDIDELVDQIIAGKIRNGQLENSNLTFQELELCTEVFKALLRSINHVRIEYPEDPDLASDSEE